MYNAFAHAHYLAKEMKARRRCPTVRHGRSSGFSDWDFNWQDSYVYKKPFILPKGTRIDVTLTYDNSADNPRNPISPPRRALFGEQSFDEMGTVGFEVRDREQGARSTLFTTRSPARNKMAIADGEQERHAGASAGARAAAKRDCSSSPSSTGRGTS